jgi:hypothetical protein
MLINLAYIKSARAALWSKRLLIIERVLKNKARKSRALSDHEEENFIRLLSVSFFVRQLADWFF